MEPKDRATQQGRPANGTTKRQAPLGERLFWPRSGEGASDQRYALPYGGCPRWCLGSQVLGPNSRNFAPQKLRKGRQPRSGWGLLLRWAPYL